MDDGWTSWFDALFLRSLICCLYICSEPFAPFLGGLRLLGLMAVCLMSAVAPAALMCLFCINGSRHSFVSPRLFHLPLSVSAYRSLPLFIGLNLASLSTGSGSWWCSLALCTPSAGRHALKPVGTLAPESAPLVACNGHRPMFLHSCWLHDFDSIYILILFHDFFFWFCLGHVLVMSLTDAWFWLHSVVISDLHHFGRQSPSACWCPWTYQEHLPLHRLSCLSRSLGRWPPWWTWLSEASRTLVGRLALWEFACGGIRRVIIIFRCLTLFLIFCREAFRRLFYFYFAKLVQAASAKYQSQAPYSCTKFRQPSVFSFPQVVKARAKRKSGFPEFCL